MTAAVAYEKSNRRGPMRRWYVRWPLKWIFFFVVVFFVCFPNPVQFARHLEHLSDYSKMIDPEHPSLAAWETELREQLTGHAKKTDSFKEQNKKTTEAGADIEADHESSSETSSDEAVVEWSKHLAPQRVQKEVEKFIYKKVPYAWDWDQWGSADYMPTVTEMFDSAKDNGGVVKEDCDGRAVMAASMMRRLGYQSTIVTDLRHVWVTTPQGEWMGPGRKKTMVSTKDGNRVNILSTISNVPVSISYGISVFPLWRELIILITAFLLIAPRGGSRFKLFVGLQLMILGLLLMRQGFFDPATLSRQVQSVPVYCGLFAVLEGLLVTLLAARGRAKANTQSVAPSVD